MSNIEFFKALNTLIVTSDYSLRCNLEAGNGAGGDTQTSKYILEDPDGIITEITIKTTIPHGKEESLS